MRDYGREERGGTQVKPYGTRQNQGKRYVVLQTWEWRGDLYDVTLYVVRDEGASRCETAAFRSTYYAVPVERVAELMVSAGFSDVRRLDDAFFQPMLVGCKPLGSGEGAAA